MKRAIQQYAIVTASYWTFTVTDGALRMLVVLYFHELGYSPFEIASLFLFYEFFGIITNLMGGWLAARLGLNITLQAGITLQITALAMLTVDPEYLGIFYVMTAQALSGIAKDLNKMSAKSYIKLLIPDQQQNRLYRWVSLLTGSKNALKGVGYFLGALLLTTIGFRETLLVLLAALIITLVFALFYLHSGSGKSSFSPGIKELFSKHPPVNQLSAARFFLFGSRDVWFVVALPVFLQAQLGWSHTSVGSFLALWIIAYGLAQAVAPRLTGFWHGQSPDGRSAFFWSLTLCMIPALIAALLFLPTKPDIVLTAGLLVYGFVFALNSAIHSYLIVAYSSVDGVSLDVGFYYMANSAGRLTGTLLSGWIYQLAGIEACLLVASALVAISSTCAKRLPSDSTLLS